MTDMNIHIQKAQQTPKMNSKTQVKLSSADNKILKERDESSSENKIISRFLIRNFGDQKAVGQYKRKQKPVKQDFQQNRPSKVRKKLRNSQIIKS